MHNKTQSNKGGNMLSRMNKSQPHRLPLKVLAVLTSIAVLLMATHLILQYLNLNLQEQQAQVFEVSNRFDMDDEASVPTWYSQFIWLGVAVSSLLAAKLSKLRSVKVTWFITALVALLFSVDEVAGLHELILQNIHLFFFGLNPATALANAWWLILPFVIAGGYFLLTRLYKVWPGRGGALMILGWFLFFTGAVVLEILGNDVPRNTFLYQGVVTGAEESFELFGGIIILYVILEYINTFYAARIKKMWRYLLEQNS